MPIPLPVVSEQPFQPLECTECGKCCTYVAIEIDPSFYNSIFMLGRVYQQLGRNEQALAAYTQFLEHVPTGQQAAAATAAVEELRGQEEARQ